MALTKNQSAFIEALRDNLGIISKAAHACNSTRQSHYDWMKSSEEYKKAFEDVSEDCKDVIENAIMDKVLGGDTTMLIFVAKCRLKDRGYVERTEINHSGEIGNRIIRVTMKKNDE